VVLHGALSHLGDRGACVFLAERSYVNSLLLSARQTWAHSLSIHSQALKTTPQLAHVLSQPEMPLFIALPTKCSRWHRQQGPCWVQLSTSKAHALPPTPAGVLPPQHGRRREAPVPQAGQQERRLWWVPWTVRLGLELHCVEQRSLILKVSEAWLHGQSKSLTPLHAPPNCAVKHTPAACSMRTARSSPPPKSLPPLPHRLNAHRQRAARGLLHLRRGGECCSSSRLATTRMLRAKHVIPLRLPTHECSS